MGRLAFAVLLLSLEVVGWAYSASNADGGVEGKASLVSGAVPPSQLGSGVANASTCLNGNSTQGSCGGGSPAGITYATTAQNWSQASTTPLTGCPTGISCGTAATITLTPCPAGIDFTSGAGYQVAITDANPEAIRVVSGSNSGPNCSITLAQSNFSHSSYTIGSASSGIQETLNAACGVYASTNTSYNAQCNVTIPANGPYLGSGGLWSLNNYNVYGTIFFHSNQSVLNGHGVSLNCLGRGPCIQVGDLVSTNDYADNTITGLSFRTPIDKHTVPAYEGVNIANTVRLGGVVTITTATAHGFRPGDMVTKLFTDQSAYWGDSVVATVPTPTTFTYPRTGSDIASHATPGVVALAYEAVLDNANNTHFTDLQYDLGGDNGHFNNFFDFWDDENATVDHFNNNGINLNANADWTGAFVFSAGNQNVNTSPVITMRDSTITANYSNCATVYNSNGLYIENTVCQASGPWQFNVSNSVGGLHGGAYFRNIYSESATYMNPLSPARSPFPGLGIAGLIAGVSPGTSTFHVAGQGQLNGANTPFAAGGRGSTPYSYFIVANDTTASTQTSPMQVLNWLSTGSDSVPIRWPRVANGTDTITYDVIRMTTPSGVGSVYPYVGGCPGGSGGTCGYVAHNLSQATACSGTLVCTYTDSGSSSTTAYTINQGTYAGLLNFWPGGVVSVNTSVTVDAETGPEVGIGLKSNPLEIAAHCGDGGGGVSPGGYTACLTSASIGVNNQSATLLTDGPPASNAMTLSKGRLNFAMSPWATVKAHHIITLVDSQPALTEATAGLRPLASANDTWVGVDNPNAVTSSAQLAFGAPVSISNYIGNTGDNTSFLERLTSKQKTFAVPVRIREGNSFTLGDGSPLSQMKMYSVNNMPASHVPPQSCVDVVGKAKGLTKSDQITSITPPGRLGNLSLNAYPADEGAIILHFCNPSRSEAITPPGAYSFLAVR
jgi:hypothetical protein